MKFHPSSVCEQSPGQQSVSELFCGIGQFSYFFCQPDSLCNANGIKLWGRRDDEIWITWRVTHILCAASNESAPSTTGPVVCVCAPATHGGRDIHDRGRIRLKVISSFFCCCCCCPAIIPSILARRTILAGCISPPATNAIIACPFLFLLCIISTWLTHASGG